MRGNPLSLDVVIARFTKCHGSLYDYSDVTLSDVSTPVRIICRNHGVFLQRPKDHYRGQRCPRCATEHMAVSQTSNSEEFIVKATGVHKGRYSYVNVIYEKSSSKVNITCKIHGDFLQTPNKHLMGRGCPVCNKRPKKNTADFIRDSVIVHGDKYDYSLVDYIGIDAKVKIICPTHGEFTQIAYTHLKGGGCSDCGTYGFNYSAPAILYYLKISHNNNTYYKVGITNRSVSTRFSLPELKKIEVISLTEYSTGREAFNIEQAILKKYRRYAYYGPLILNKGNTEIFTVDISSLEPNLQNPVE